MTKGYHSTGSLLVHIIEIVPKYFLFYTSRSNKQKGLEMIPPRGQSSRSHVEGVVAAVERARHPSNPMNKKLKELLGHWIPLAFTGAMTKKKKQSKLLLSISLELHSKFLDFNPELSREFVSRVLFSATRSSCFRKLSACA